MDIYVPVIIKLNRKFISSSINYFLKKKKKGGGMVQRIQISK